MASPDVHIIPGPPRAADSLASVAAAWVKRRIIPPAAAWDSERRALAAVAILVELHDAVGIRNPDHLGQLFDRLTAGETPLIDALLADAAEGSPVLALTHWETIDGRSATSFVFRLTDHRDEPTLAPSDEWHAMLEGKLSLARVLDTFVESSVVPFKREAR